MFQRHLCLKYPSLGYLNFSKHFVLYTDASHLGIGGVLMQEQDGHFKIIRYLSRTLNPAERRYSASERECLAIVHELAIVKPCILGTNFTSMTDCRALTTMGEKTNCNS